MANYPIPPWLTQADPVQSYTHGLQIGSQIGEQQAAQQLHQESIARQEQKDQIEQEVQQAKIHLSADAAARKYAAQSKYQSLVGSGVDPIQALLKVGPEMGITGPALAQLTKENQPKVPFSLNVQEQGGERFLQTSPDSFQHIPNAKLAAPKIHFNPDGTVSMFDDKDGLTVIGKPRATGKGKARYTFKKANGDTISGTTDDPEVSKLVQDAKDAAKKAEDEAAAANAPGAGFHPFDAIKKFFSPPPVAAPETPFKILGIRKKGETPVPDLSSAPDQPDDTTE